MASWRSDQFKKAQDIFMVLNLVKHRDFTLPNDGHTWRTINDKQKYVFLCNSSRQNLRTFKKKTSQPVTKLTSTSWYLWTLCSG